MKADMMAFGKAEKKAYYSELPRAVQWDRLMVDWMVDMTVV